MAKPIDIKIVSDTITPRLKELIKTSGSMSKSILGKLGSTLQDQIVQSFANPMYRVEPWKPKSDGSNCTLQRSTALRSSIQVTKHTSKFVEVSTDRKYAPFHQFGTRRGLPARPFFPYKNGQLGDRAEKILYAVGKAQLDAELKKRKK